MREGSEVTGAAEGAVLVDDGRDPGVEHVGHGLRDLRPYSRVPRADGLEPQEHQGPYDLPLHPRPHPRRVRTNDVALQLCPQLLADVPGRQGAEAGGHAIDGLGLGRQRIHDPASRSQRRDRLLRQLDPGPTPRHGKDVGRGDPGRPHHHSVHIHIQERTQ